MNELKPCPFCGGKVEIVGIKNGNSFIVWCENCGLGFGIEKEYYLYQIIGAWNHRAEQGQSEKVAELKRELERVKQERDAAVYGAYNASDRDKDGRQMRVEKSQTDENWRDSLQMGRHNKHN